MEKVLIFISMLFLIPILCVKAQIDNLNFIKSNNNDIISLQADKYKNDLQYFNQTTTKASNNLEFEINEFSDYPYDGINKSYQIIYHLDNDILSFGYGKKAKELTFNLVSSTSKNVY